MKSEPGFSAVALFLQPFSSPVCTAAEIVKVALHLGPLDVCCNACHVNLGEIRRKAVQNWME